MWLRGQCMSIDIILYSTKILIHYCFSCKEYIVWIRKNSRCTFLYVKLFGAKITKNTCTLNVDCLVIIVSDKSICKLLYDNEIYLVLQIAGSLFIKNYIGYMIVNNRLLLMILRYILYTYFTWWLTITWVNIYD